VDRKTLLNFDAKAELLVFVCRRAGLNPVIGQRQQWKVAQHTLVVEPQLDQNVRNVLYVRSGWPKPPIRKSLCLAEVYAIATTHTVRPFNPPELARFKAMALIEAELVERPAIRLQALPGDAPAAATATWALIGELLTIRAVSGDTGPTPLVAPWLAALNGTPENTIRTGKHWLEQHHFITHIDDAPGRYGRPTKLWQSATEATP
jgi:hypothetical protein